MRAKRILAGVGALVAVVAGAVVLYMARARPVARPPSVERVESTPERVARGRYLAESVTGCVHCHSPRDWSRYAGPARPPPAGGDCWGEAEKVPGRVCAPNLTPDPRTGLGDWTDGEIMRAIREGVDRRGRALFPVMPYQQYRHLSDADTRALVAWIRSLEPVRQQVPSRRLRFPVSYFITRLPRPLDGPVDGPDPGDPVERGEYLARVAGCRFCHTPVDEHEQPVAERAFAGGHEFTMEWGRVRAPNLTPHSTGLGGRREENFLNLFRAFRDPSLAELRVTTGQNTVMPWHSLTGMTDEDLRAIWTYLQTVEPIPSLVDVWPEIDPPTMQRAPRVQGRSGVQRGAGTERAPGTTRR